MPPLSENAVRRLNDGAPGWVCDLRQRGYDYFQRLAMPSSKEEVWRYVDLAFDLADLQLAGEPPAGLAEEDEIRAALGAIAGSATIVDGSTVAVASETNEVAFTSLRAALTERSDGLKRVFGTGAGPDLDRFSAAHHAFFSDGVFLHVPGNCQVERPLYVDVQAVSEGSVSFPHVTVVVDSNAEVSLVLAFRSSEGRFLVVNP